jgi:Polyketide cyclase / dehydrase and lipid transport
MRRTIDYVLEVRTLEPDHLMVMESIKSPFPMHVTYQFDALDPGTTRATIRVQGTARTFYGLTDAVMAPMVKRNLRNDLRRLKARMEQE